jgi:membrane fusion protein
MAPLFRREVVQRQSDRLSGDVAIAVPISWQTVGYLLAGSVAAAGVFFCLARYARVETVVGAIVPDAGIASIVPTRSGVVSAISVREGQHVMAGANLAAIRAEEDGAMGTSASAQLEAAIAQQDASLLAQVEATRAAANAQLNQLSAQQTGLRAEIEQIQSQINFQQGLVASALKDFERAKTLSGSGYISPRELQAREETLLSRRQNLAQLQQALETRRTALAEAERSSAQTTAQARAQGASLAAARAEVAQLAANANGSRSYVLRAPVAGRVTALTARVGNPATPQSPIMIVVPSGSALRAELAAPSAAIGFIRPAQEVRIAIDAFPYQRFGTIKGRVLTVASSPINQQGPNGAVVPVYPVTVALYQTNVSAFGQDRPLLPGMTLTARIVTEKQTLLEWLFEPLFAVRRR